MPAHPPVIAMSSLVGSRERSREAGFDGHIRKPYDEAAVIAAVRAATRHFELNVPGTRLDARESEGKPG